MDYLERKRRSQDIENELLEKEKKYNNPYRYIEEEEGKIPYNNYYRLLQNIYINGKIAKPRGSLTREIIGTNLIIDNYNMVSTPVHRSFENVFSYWYNEACWYLSGDCNPDKILRHAKMWGNIKNEDGTVNSNYGHRVFYRKNKYNLSAFEFAYKCLENDKETRNAIIIYNEPDLCFIGNKDFICSQYQHFMIRENKLICIIGLRSSDAIFGLYYNIPWWSLVHQQLFILLKSIYPEITLGEIKVSIDSAHIYENHFEISKKILESVQEFRFIEFQKIIPIGNSFEWYFENLKSFFSTRIVEI